MTYLIAGDWMRDGYLDGADKLVVDYVDGQFLALDDAHHVLCNLPIDGVGRFIWPASGVTFSPNDGEIERIRSQAGQ